MFCRRAWEYLCCTETLAPTSSTPEFPPPINLLCNGHTLQVHNQSLRRLNVERGLAILDTRRLELLGPTHHARPVHPILPTKRQIIPPIRPRQRAPRRQPLRLNRRPRQPRQREPLRPPTPTARVIIRIQQQHPHRLPRPIKARIRGVIRSPGIQRGNVLRAGEERHGGRRAVVRGAHAVAAPEAVLAVADRAVVEVDARDVGGGREEDVIERPEGRAEGWGDARCAAAGDCGRGGLVAVVRVG